MSNHVITLNDDDDNEDNDHDSDRHISKEQSNIKCSIWTRDSNYKARRNFGITKCH